MAGQLATYTICVAQQKHAILLAHGKSDRTIPSIASSLVSSKLEAAGFNSELKVEPIIGHTISMIGAHSGLAFQNLISVELVRR